MAGPSTERGHGYGAISRDVLPSPHESDSELTISGYDFFGDELPHGSKVDVNDQTVLSFRQTCIVIFGISGVTFSASLAAGLLVVGLPVMAKDLDLPDHLILWPSSAYALACGCCLLLAGSVADRVGDRTINLAGSILMAIAVAGTGLARDGTQLIAARVLQGIGVSMCLPTGVSILTRSLPPGRSRNIGFSCLGAGQPLGFSLGLVMEGMMENLGQWRFGYYISTVILAGFVVTNWAVLPMDTCMAEYLSLTSLVIDIDWVGVAMASSCLGIISYSCAIITEDPQLLWQAGNMTAVILASALAPTVFWWMKRQDRMGKPALIPMSIWTNRVFAAISFMVFLTWGSYQSSILITSLFFQKVQQVAPLEASLRLVPNVLVGIGLNPLTGLCVQYFNCAKLLATASLVAAISPLLMSIIDPNWAWWMCSFWAVVLGPVAVNVLFTLAHIIITDIFPPDMHALAGAVFQTMSQLGTSLGVSLIAIVSSCVTKSSNLPDKESPAALMVGYRTSFTTCFFMMVICAATSLSLRSLGRLGLERNERA